jgi:alkanesulfonate monooxygenase SsuD/methylene tetrahydromethanopterin reductase-like flavin-dependent oxidoreductase (luciferase family)
MGMTTDPWQRAFRFGTFAFGDPDGTGTQWMDQARRAEGEGYSTLVVGDHYLTTTACTARLAMAVLGHMRHQCCGVGAGPSPTHPSGRR